MRTWKWIPATIALPILVGIWATRNGRTPAWGRARTAGTIAASEASDPPAVSPQARADARPLGEAPSREEPFPARTSAAMTLYRDTIERPLDEPMLRQLEETLRSDSAPLLDWTTALWALARHEMPETIEILARYARSSALASRRRNAVTHLGRMHGPAVVVTLVDLTAAGPSDPVAVEAFRALARRAEPEARAIYDTLVRNESWSSFVPSRRNNPKR